MPKGCSFVKGFGHGRPKPFTKLKSFGQACV